MTKHWSSNQEWHCIRAGTVDDLQKVKIKQTLFISPKTNKAKKVVGHQTLNGNILMLQLPQKWVAGKSNFARHKAVIFDGTQAHSTHTLN